MDFREYNQKWHPRFVFVFHQHTRQCPKNTFGVGSLSYLWWEENSQIKSKQNCLAFFFFLWTRQKGWKVMVHRWGAYTHTHKHRYTRHYSMAARTGLFQWQISAYGSSVIRSVILRRCYDDRSVMSSKSQADKKIRSSCTALYRFEMRLISLEHMARGVCTRIAMTR